MKLQLFSDQFLYSMAALFLDFYCNSNIFNFVSDQAAFHADFRLLSGSKVVSDYCQGIEMKSKCFHFHTNLIVIVDTERLNPHINLTHWTVVLVIVNMLLNAIMTDITDKYEKFKVPYSTNEKHASEEFDPKENGGLDNPANRHKDKVLDDICDTHPGSPMCKVFDC